MLKFLKCQFGIQRVEYLGHVVSDQGVEMDGAKISAIVQWLVPINLKKLRGYLGLTGYYRRFIRQYSQLARLLTDLLKKDNFHWNPKANKAFKALKVAITITLVLALPNFSQPFTIETDASGLGIGLF